jgi:outer membrane murein-binding lipoprotein Lpp
MFMKTRLNVMVCAACVAAILLGGCVSSKKYKASQAALEKVRSDSASLAQQVSSLNGNLHDLQERNTSLQRSLDSTSNNYATQQRSLTYYQNYFNQQQSALSQVSQQLKDSLSHAGLGDDAVQQENNAVYVRLDEDKIFKKNSMAVTSSGKQALSSLAQTIRNRSDLNVFVSSGDSSSGGQNGAMTYREGANQEPGANPSMNAEPRHRVTHHRMAAGKANAGNGAGAQANASKSANQNQAAQSQNGGQPSTAAAPRKPHHRRSNSEGGMTYYSNSGNMHNKAWALKQGRMYAVAHNFLQDGVPKVNLSLQQPTMGGPQSNSIRVVLTPMMTDFNPEKNPGGGPR